MPENTTAQNNNNDSDKRAQLRRAALEYHEFPKPGKLAIAATKQMINQHDLALAYSPGVAAPCEEIVKDPANAFRYTSRGNLVAVISNGTAVLGLGDIGPEAGMPVMEGKCALFKAFADVDAFPLCVKTHDVDEFVNAVYLMSGSFGGINLEDISAPRCFEIERKLKEKCDITIFHDDQHGTAVITLAGLTNALKVVGKKKEDVKIVTSGAGAAAIACLDMMVSVGLRRENIYVCDSKGVIYEGREPNMEPTKARYAQKTEGRTLGDVIAGADVFLGLSTAGVLKPEMVAKMADKPLIFALANPNPEILPADAKAVRPDCIIATGRADFPN